MEALLTAQHPSVLLRISCKAKDCIAVLLYNEEFELSYPEGFKNSITYLFCSLKNIFTNFSGLFYFQFFFSPHRFQLWESPSGSCQHECQCSCRARPGAHPHAGGSSVLAGCHRCCQASQADGQRWQCHHLHGQLHAEETAAVWQAEEAGHHHSHPSSPGTAVPHAEESHPEGVHQHRRMEISLTRPGRPLCTAAPVHGGGKFMCWVEIHAVG